MAEATAVSGRIDLPMTTGIIVLAAVGILIALNKLTISLG